MSADSFRSVSVEVEEPIGLSFRQVRAILAAAFRVAPQKEATFVARLQQLQKLKLPMGTNARQGAKGGGRASYEGWQLAELGLYLDLLDAGMTPAGLKAHFADAPLFRMENVGELAETAPAETGLLMLLYIGALDTVRGQGDHVVYLTTDPAMLSATLVNGAGIAVNLTTRLSVLKAEARRLFPEIRISPLVPFEGTKGRRELPGVGEGFGYQIGGG